MGVIGHETVGVDFNLITLLKPQQQVVVNLLHSIGLKEPFFVVALPRDMKEGTVINNHVSWMSRHAGLNIKSCATERKKLQGKQT